MDTLRTNHASTSCTSMYMFKGHVCTVHSSPIMRADYATFTLRLRYDAVCEGAK